MIKPQTEIAPSDPVIALLAPLTLQQATDSRRLIQIFADVSGYTPKPWGSIIGFGSYDYTYQSGRSGTSLATGFAPRKTEFVLYIMPGYADFSPILADLGPHRLGKSCLYFKKLDALNESALRALIRAGLDDLAKLWPVRA